MRSESDAGCDKAIRAGSRQNEDADPEALKRRTARLVGKP